MGELNCKYERYMNYSLNYIKLKLVKSYAENKTRTTDKNSLRNSEFILDVKLT